MQITDEAQVTITALVAHAVALSRYTALLSEQATHAQTAADARRLLAEAATLTISTRDAYQTVANAFLQYGEQFHTGDDAR